MTAANDVGNPTKMVLGEIAARGGEEDGRLPISTAARERAVAETWSAPPLLPRRARPRTRSSADGTDGERTRAAAEEGTAAAVAVRRG